MPRKRQHPSETAWFKYENVTPNTVPQYNGATPTKPSDEENHYTFSGWSPAVVAATEDATYTAQFAATPNDKIVDDETYNVPTSTQVTVTNLIIKDDGVVKIPTTSRVNATNLYLEATSDASGQLITNANTSINITGSAYFDWTMNGSAGSVRRTWYAVAVPWEVDARTGITDKATGRMLTAGRDFDLIYYQGNVRASEGPGYQCWKYAEDGDGDKIMHPGRAYMMYFGSEFETIRFENYDDTPFDEEIMSGFPVSYYMNLQVGVNHIHYQKQALGTAPARASRQG